MVSLYVRVFSVLQFRQDLSVLYGVLFRNEKKHFCEDSFVLRTTDVHTYHVESDIDDRGRLSSNGVRGQCPFNVLDYFDVTRAFPLRSCVTY